MPSTYAHYRLGREVEKQLSGKEKRLVTRYPDLYNIGLHGPDILFYYGALKSNPVNETGYGLHEKSGASFFENACRVIPESPDPEAARAYALGVLCHFALDVKCHPCVEETIRKSGVSHSEIEVEFDRSLMVRDGLNPVTHVLTGHIHPQKRWAEIIAPFYPGITPEQVEKSLRSMVLLLRLLMASNPVKKSLIYGVFRLTGHSEDMNGLVLNPKGNPLLKDSNEKLSALYSQAVQLARHLITSFDDFIPGNVPPDSVFDLNFEGCYPEEKTV